MGKCLLWGQAAIALFIAAGWLAAPAYADALGVIVQRVDASQFPTVRLYVSVTNSSGAPVTGLDAGAFVVQEDGKPVDSLAIEPGPDPQDPIASALVIDVGASMGDERKLDNAKAAATSYIDALGPNDRGTVVSFASRVTVVQEYTSDKAALKSAVDSLAAGGKRVQYDAIAQTARRQAGLPERRKPIILLTDGLDSASNESLDAAILAATTASSPVYTIGLGGAVSRDVLTQLAASTGGRAVFVSDPGDLRSTFLAISDQLRRQYVLRYTSRLSPDTAQHGLAVQATSLGQSATGLKSFTTPPPSITTTPPEPTPVPPVATPAPVAAASPEPAGVSSTLLIGLVLLLVLVAVAVWYLLQGREPAPAAPAAISPAPPPAPIEKTRTRDDVTEEVKGAAPPAGVTRIRNVPQRPAPQVRLTVVQHGQPNDILVHDWPIILGRAKERATAWIQDPLVSSEHARIRWEGAQFFVDDLSSKNGTQVNGEPILPGTPHALKNNDQIYLGDTVVKFVVDAR